MMEGEWMTKIRRNHFVEEHQIDYYLHFNTNLSYKRLVRRIGPLRGSLQFNGVLVNDEPCKWCGEEYGLKLLSKFE